jgi:hypothetical protein
MRQRARVTLAVFFWALLVSLVTAPFGAEEKPQEAPQAVTTADPEIPIEELTLLLKPLTKDELLIEADAWQVLLQEKAEEIARAEIAVQRQNRKIEARAETQQVAKTAAQTMERAEESKKEEKVALLEQSTPCSPRWRPRPTSKTPIPWRRSETTSSTPAAVRGIERRCHGRDLGLAGRQGLGDVRGGRSCAGS